MATAEQQHHAWLARSFGRTDYLPLSESDLAALASAGEYVDKYPGTHLFKEGGESTAAFVVQRGDVELYRRRNGERRVVARVDHPQVLVTGHPYVDVRATFNSFVPDALPDELAARLVEHAVLGDHLVKRVPVPGHKEPKKRVNDFLVACRLVRLCF